MVAASARFHQRRKGWIVMSRTAEVPTGTSATVSAPMEQPLPTAHEATGEPDLVYRRRVLELELDIDERRQKFALTQRRHEQDLALKRFVVSFACATFGTCVLVALCLFCFQGFHTAGFHLEPSLMHWIGGATIGSLASIITLVYKRLL